jgi:hypothetical protein
MHSIRLVWGPVVGAWRIRGWRRRSIPYHIIFISYRIIFSPYSYSSAKLRPSRIHIVSNISKNYFVVSYLWPCVWFFHSHHQTYWVWPQPTLKQLCTTVETFAFPREAVHFCRLASAQKLRPVTGRPPGAGTTGRLAPSVLPLSNTPSHFNSLLFGLVWSCTLSYKAKKTESSQDQIILIFWSIPMASGHAFYDLFFAQETKETKKFESQKFFVIADAPIVRA